MLAWYFASENNRLNYGDNRLIEIGKMHTVKHKPVLCKKGLHGSVQLLDALGYAPGPMLYRVDITRKLDIRHDKLCGQRRQYLAGFDATSVLQEFTRMQNLIHIKHIKPYCSDGQYEVILEWLNTGNPDLRAATVTAAKSAASTCTWSSANSDVEAAAQRVAGFTAHQVVEAAAQYFLLSTVRYANRYAIRNSNHTTTRDALLAANEMLTEMVEAAMLKIA